ncbi:MAG: phosphate ABC transporter substrate-binding protein [Spirochaetes bacterium]|nr:phosphate ABC transporter substrate-binding protein [Spirochaetota bacterium]
MIKQLKKIFIYSGAFSLLFLSVSCEKGKNISITGSTTVLPIAQSCAEYYMYNIDKKAKITVSGGGSGVGIAAIIDGKADIGSSSRKIKEEEINNAKNKGVNVNEIIIALDGIAVIVNNGVNLTNLTMEELKGIYNGSVNNWKQVGGEDKQIIVVSRDTSSGTYGSFIEMVLHKDKLRSDAMMVSSNQAMATTVSQTPFSIGYIGLGFLNSSKIKALKINEVEASESNIKNNTYPISRTLQMYINGNPQGDIKKFLDFILSKKGQELIEESGYIKL